MQTEANGDKVYLARRDCGQVTDVTLNGVSMWGLNVIEARQNNRGNGYVTTLYGRGDGEGQMKVWIDGQPKTYTYHGEVVIVEA